MRKLTAIILVLSIIFCLSACGKKDKNDGDNECGVFVTVEADDVYAVSCGTEEGSDTATPADGGAIEAGTEYHFDIAGDMAQGKESLVIPYMICIYDDELNIISEASFEDNFANMARIDIVVTEAHNIIYKGGSVDCGGKFSVTLNEQNIADGVYATDVNVCVKDNAEASEKINDALAEISDSFMADADANLQSYTDNTAGFEGEIPAFCMYQAVSISRGDKNLASFRIKDYVYLGTQELITISAHCYDVETGEEIGLNDVFSDVDALTELCREHILVSTTEDNALYNEGFTDAIPELVTDGNWYFSNEGLVIIANRGDMADVSHEFTIPYSDLDGYINEDYLPEDLGKLAPGSISACFGSDAADSGFTFIGNDSDAPEGDDIVISASGDVRNISVYSVVYNEESGSYDPEHLLFYCSDLRDGGAFALDAALQSTPNILVKYSTTYGSTVNNLLSVDENGNMVVTDPNGGDQGIDITEDMPYTLDINCDSNDDEISIDGGTVTVTSGGKTASYKTDIELLGSVILHDSDGDGQFEIFVVGDMCSDDYIIYCLKYDGELKAIPFDGNDYCSGGISSFSEKTVTVNSRIDVLGTYGCKVDYEYSGGEFVSANQSGYEVLSETNIAPVVDLLTVEGGTIPARTELKVIGTDLYSYVTVRASDGTTATLSLASSDGDTGWLINNVPEAELFDYLPYAD